MSTKDYKPEIRARLKAVRAFHPAPWRVVGGTLVDGEGNPVDMDLPAVRHFFQHLLLDLESLTESERRRSVTRELKSSSPGFRGPTSVSDAELVAIDVLGERPPRRRE